MTTTVRYTVLDGEVIAEKRAGSRKQYVPDPLGSTVALLDSTQVQTDTFTYWPYGEEVSRTGTTPTPFRFVGTAGYYRDSANKTYVRARYLDMAKGRWLTEDPIEYTGGDWNLYRYVANRPTIGWDPSGLFCPGQPPQPPQPNPCDQNPRPPRIGPCSEAMIASCTIRCAEDGQNYTPGSCYWFATVPSGPHEVTDRFCCDCEKPKKKTFCCHSECHSRGPTPPCGIKYHGYACNDNLALAIKQANTQACKNVPQKKECQPGHGDPVSCTKKGKPIRVR